MNRIGKLINQLEALQVKDQQELEKLKALTERAEKLLELIKE